MAELPEGYEADCFKQGALTRMRGVSSPADLMMLSMFHLQNGCTLMEISEVARITKLGEMSDVAFMKRFEKCGDWFKAINSKIAPQALVNYQKPRWMEGLEPIGVDASDVVEKGRSGRVYRLHYALDIFGMKSADHSITDVKVGESLVNFRLTSEHLVLGDRAYATVNGIQHCESCGAKFVLRLRKNSFTVRDENGKAIDIVQEINDEGENASISIRAYATNLAGARIPIRICAKKKDSEAIANTRKKLKRRESKQQRAISEGTKVFNEHIVVVTNLEDSISAEEVLEAYRLRWQVEIYFKRLKSILDFGELPKRREGSVIAWLNGKLMIALLLEIVISRASFPPQEHVGQERLEGGEVREPLAENWVLRRG
jgi:hypothetical protein